MVKHTPAPWRVCSEGGICVDYEMYGDKAIIAETFGPNAERIVECVNALEGLNPEHLPELIRAVEEFNSFGLHFKPLVDAMKRLRGETT